MKRGVYKPVRKVSSSKTLAALATFVMSGILHEYVLLLKSVPSSENNLESSKNYINYEPSYGNQFCFFAWNGMLMALEYFVLNWTMTAKLKLPVPPLVKSMLIISLSLPVSHWFTDEYVRSGIFSHYAIGFPTVVRLN